MVKMTLIKNIKQIIEKTKAIDFNLSELNNF